MTTPTRLLHLAPEERLRTLLKAHPNTTYVGGDLVSPLRLSGWTSRGCLSAPGRSMSSSATTALNVSRAIGGRCGGPSACRNRGGSAIRQVPMWQGLQRTEEDPAIAEPGDREERFDHRDHVRICAPDSRERLRGVGLAVDVYGFEEGFGTQAKAPVCAHHGRASPRLLSGMADPGASRRASQIRTRGGVAVLSRRGTTARAIRHHHRDAGRAERGAGRRIRVGEGECHRIRHVRPIR